jgi:taurine dioxygenase
MAMETGPLRLGAWPVAGQVGAVVRTIDLSDGLSDEQVNDLHQLLAERGVVFFAAQKMGPDGHRDFARLLGDIRMPPDFFPSLRDDGYPDIGVIVSEGGGGRGAGTWHTDVPWAPNPPRYSILHFQEGPAGGGDTMWASQIAAYQRLSPPMREFITPLTAEFKRISRIEDRSAIHPLVQRHPVSGELALYVSPSNTTRIVELDPNESDAVLALLFNTVLRPESICRWKWSPGDIGIWDNHFVLHHAIDDYGDERRVIHRIEIEGEPLIPATA